MHWPPEHAGKATLKHSRAGSITSWALARGHDPLGCLRQSRIGEMRSATHYTVLCGAVLALRLHPKNNNSAAWTWEPIGVASHWNKWPPYMLCGTAPRPCPASAGWHCSSEGQVRLLPAWHDCPKQTKKVNRILGRRACALQCGCDLLCRCCSFRCGRFIRKGS